MAVASEENYRSVAMEVVSSSGGTCTEVYGS
jgi:hypothetical protein